MPCASRWRAARRFALAVHSGAAILRRRDRRSADGAPALDAMRARRHDHTRSRTARQRPASATRFTPTDAFVALVEEALDVIVLIDAVRGSILHANRATERCLGHRPSALVGSHFSVLFAETAWQTPEALLDQVRVCGAELGQQEFRRADGSVVPMDINARMMRWGVTPIIVATLRDVSERVRSEEALRRSEERLELVLRGADLGLWDWNIETGELVYNDRAAEMLGYAPDEIERHVRVWTTFVHPDDDARVRRLLLAHLRGETPAFESEHRVRSKSGAWVWVLVRGRVVRRGPDGRPLRATGTQSDVSERKRVEEERATLLELARELSATLDLGALVAAVERRTAGALPADAVATIYWDVDAEAYRLLSQYGFPAADERLARRMRFALGSAFGGALGRGETLIVEDADGWPERERRLMRRFDLAAFGAVPLVIRGQMRGAFVAATRRGRALDPPRIHFLEAIAHQLAVAIETSALYRAQQAAAEYSASMARVGQELIAVLATPRLYGELCRLTTAVLDCEVSSTFLWMADDGAYGARASHGDGAEHRETLALVRLTPSMMAEVLRAFAATGLVRLEQLPHDDPVRRALTGAHGVSHGVLVALRRGEDVIGFHCAATRRREPFTRQQERIARGVGQIASLALESARLFEELERANRVKSDFVATISHELRTPLNVVIGYHDLLLEGEFGPLTDAQTERLRRADESARELLDLINATLDLSRIEARRMPVDMRAVDVAGLVRELDGAMALLRTKPDVALCWRMPHDLPALRTDAMKLRVILKNLIHNAIKFTDRGTVTVTIAVRDGRMQFEVADTGIGIAPEVLPAMFEAFRQGDSSSTRSYGGVGLGLYIVRRLLELLGGEISAESEVGRGSRFRFSLPLGE
jgi:PAS domain S-box-containing protein